MKEVILGLEKIADAVKKTSQPKAVAEAIQNVKTSISKAKSTGMLSVLDEELTVWLKKIDVILKEPAGRQGMVKHLHHWIQKFGAMSSEFGEKNK